MPTEWIIYTTQVAEIGNTIDPGTGERVQESGVSFSVMVPFAALSDPAAWATALEAVRLRLLEDPAVIAAGGGQ
jgi:hypothetical protein